MYSLCILPLSPDEGNPYKDAIKQRICFSKQVFFPTKIPAACMLTCSGKEQELHLILP